MYKVLVTDPISDKGLAIIRDAGLEVIYEPSLSEERLNEVIKDMHGWICLLYTSPSPRDGLLSRMPSSA